MFVMLVWPSHNVASPVKLIVVTEVLSQLNQNSMQVCGH